MSADKHNRLPTLKEALVHVGSGDGFSSFHVENGRTRTGHIRRDGRGVLCGADKRMARHYGNTVANVGDEFPVWLRANWELGICRTCLRAMKPLRKRRDSHGQRH